MLFKRRKRSDRKKKTTPIFLLIILPTSLLGLVLLGLYIYFSSGVARVATPLYEEIYSTTNKLHKGITKIDYTLYEFLFGILQSFQSGAQMKNRPAMFKGELPAA